MAVYLGSNQVNMLGGLNESYTLLATQEFTTSTTSTTATSVGTMTIEGISDTHTIIYVRIRDKAGKRAGYFYGSDCFFINAYKSRGSTSPQAAAPRYILSYDTNEEFWGYAPGTTGGAGVYAYSIANDGTDTLTIYQKYNSSLSLTIDGTYIVEVYKLTYPDDVSPFDA